MTVTRKNTNVYNAFSPSTTHLLPLPPGSVAGDFVVIAAVNPSWSAVFDLHGSEVTEYLNAGNMNTMHYGLWTKTISTGNIDLGYLTLDVSTSQRICAYLIGYQPDAVALQVGRVWDRQEAANETGTTNINWTEHEPVDDNGTDDVLLFALIKHSAGIFMTFTPPGEVSSFGSATQTGSGVPSMWAGRYNGTPGMKTVMSNVYAINGVGFTAAVLDAELPPAPGPELMGVWDGAALDPVEMMGFWTGATLIGAETHSVV